ncbi:GGDEF domain-containing protein [Vibrio sp. RE86]|uniref:GGDEF domain-containing protein n=1 Tax=Vibrio sp. RE86 TaxID=2607605 RepID=UPI001493A853|nr:GGDEF domain-containing protein [Vibrio sp. RE86]NOH81051.1 GGDEF domain-containing protein [Vibrio sp. RE86]
MIQSNGLFEFGQIELNERLEMLSLCPDTCHDWKSKLCSDDLKRINASIYPALLKHFQNNETLSLVLGHFAIHQTMDQYLDILFNKELNQDYIDNISKHALKLANHGVNLNLYSIIAFEYKRLLMNLYSESVSCDKAIDLLTRRLQLDMMLILECLHHKELEDVKRYASLMEIKDSLTDLYTYNTFINEVDRIIAHCQRTKSPALLLEVNIKDMAQLNKLHGYEAGNQVLQSFASLTQDFIRKTDVIARGENDTFFLIMPDTSNKDGRLICERLIENFERNSDLPITLRFGGASFDPSLNTPLEQLLTLAHEHLEFARDRSKVTDKHEFSIHFPQSNNVVRLIK